MIQWLHWFTECDTITVTGTKEMNEMSTMLGTRLHRERTFTCKFGCCTRTDAHRRRTTKNERARDKRAWRREITRER